MSGIWGEAGVPMSQCITGNGHMGTPSPPEQNDRQTPVKTLLFRNFFCGWYYKKNNKNTKASRSNVK